MKWKWVPKCLVSLMMFLPLLLHAQQASLPTILRKATIEQRLDEQVPLQLTFRDEEGRTVQLGDYFGKRPVVLSLVYFDCPSLCTEVLNGELHTFQSMSLNLGQDFDAVTVSFDPKDTPTLAKAKRDTYIGQYGRPNSRENWHFLTGDEASIQALTQAVGFGYAYDPALQQYAHAAAILLLTPRGRISRYFYGVEYPERDLRLGLVEASQEKIGTITDQILLYCYHYDPSTGKYGLVIMNVLRAGGLITLLALGSLIFLISQHTRKRPASTIEAHGKAR